MSGTTVGGRAAMRISVVGWRTGDEDVRRAVAAVRDAWAGARGAAPPGA